MRYLEKSKNNDFQVILFDQTLEQKNILSERKIGSGPQTNEKHQAVQTL